MNTGECNTNKSNCAEHIQNVISKEPTITLILQIIRRLYMTEARGKEDDDGMSHLHQISSFTHINHFLCVEQHLFDAFNVAVSLPQCCPQLVDLRILCSRCLAFILHGFLYKDFMQVELYCKRNVGNQSLLLGTLVYIVFTKSAVFKICIRYFIVERNVSDRKYTVL